MVRDFSRYALQLYSKTSSNARQRRLCKMMVKRPAKNQSLFEHVWKNHVYSLKDMYVMNQWQYPWSNRINECLLMRQYPAGTLTPLKIKLTGDGDTIWSGAASDNQTIMEDIFMKSVIPFNFCIIFLALLFCKDSAVIGQELHLIKKSATDESLPGTWPVLKHYDQTHLARIAFPVGLLTAGVCWRI